MAMNRWNKISIRVRTFMILSALVLITLAGEAVMIWYTYQMDALFSTVIEKDVAALEQVEELNIELIKQKGFVSYYFIDGDKGWLDQLDEYRKEFKRRLKVVNEFVCCGKEKEILERIESEYAEYVRSKDEVIAMYKAGERQGGGVLHEQVRDHFFKIVDLFNEFKDLRKQRIKENLHESKIKARQYRLIAVSAIAIAVMLGALLAHVLVTQILEPIRKLAQQAASNKRPSSARPGTTRDESHATGTASGGLSYKSPGKLKDEVAELGDSVHGLIEEVVYTRTELEQSQERLLQSEKMTVMGKLAADVAHSIRNPMTSIKMRLFSLERSLELTSDQKEDFEVVFEEMRRLDNIVRAFLEFSRPPKLKKQRLNISEIFDMTFQLLSHRLEQDEVEVERPHRYALPEIEGDRELLKEVLVNLIVNALEAMPKGGKIRVIGEEAVAEKMGRAILIRISDTGPGIPEQLQEKVFEPFFSTKEDGTGLGLPIARRIIEEHGGYIGLRSEEARGTTFIIMLPVKEDEQ